MPKIIKTDKPNKITTIKTKHKYKQLVLTLFFWVDLYFC